METSFVLSTEATIDAARIMVRNSLEWSILLVGSENRICNSFKDWVISLYECLFTRIELWLPFSDFEVVVLNHLKVILPNIIWDLMHSSGYSSCMSSINIGNFPLDYFVICYT